MANINPTAIFAGYTAADGFISIPIADLPGVTAALADPTTGDGRAIAEAICERYYAAITALPTGNRPASMGITKATPTGVAVGVVRQAYTMTFDLQLDPTRDAIVPES